MACCLIAVCLLGSALAGCTTVRSDLGTTDSSCYLALPAASRAVRAEGRLVGVHLFTLGRLRELAPRLSRRLVVPHPPPREVCAIEFTGTFTAESVVMPVGRRSGHLAVVVLASPSNRLLGTVLLQHPPLRFQHAHMG